MQSLPINTTDITHILSYFGLSFTEVTNFCDSSRGEDDIRWNFVLDKKYVLKINSEKSMWEARLQEISRLISRYQSIGLYCPSLVPTLQGAMSHRWEKDGQCFTCFVEEYAKYPVYDETTPHDRKAVSEHLGMLAAKYTDTDLSEIRSMWSIIDLAPLDDEVDEKQENTDMLVNALRGNGYPELADRVDALNKELRAAILPDFRSLPRCVFQGDLNMSNELHDHGKFVGLIDFNCSGTDVNINVFLNETNWFPEENEFDEMSVDELLTRMDTAQEEAMALVLKHYTLSELERKHLPHFKKITDLFQYPNVCAMMKWLQEGERREKCVTLITAVVDSARYSECALDF